MPPRARTFHRVDELLAERYGVKLREPGDPLDTLIRTILSQHTTDAPSIPAFDALKQRFPDWCEALAAGPAEIAEPIAPAGLAPTKSRRIHALLEELAQECEELSLEHLCDMEPHAAEEYLLSFKGVGPKTAAIVLLFDCGMPRFPVDTHIHRLSARLVWIGERTTPYQAYELLTEMIPDELHYQLHLNIVQHGRETCRPSRPDCYACPISRFCDAYRNAEVEPRSRDSR